MSVKFSKDHDEEYNPYSAPTADMSDYDDDYFEYDTTPFYKATGRIGRVRFLAYSMMMALSLLAMLAIFGILITIISLVSESIAMVIGIAMYVVVFIFSLQASFAPSMRRLNDLNRTGFIALLYFVPIINVLLWLYLALVPGDEEMNDYGAPAEPPTTAMTVLAAVFPIFAVVMSIAAMIVLPAYQSHLGGTQSHQSQQITQTQ